MNFELGTSCKLAPAGAPHPRSPSPKERGAVRSSAAWGCKENSELGTSCKLAPAGGSDGRVYYTNSHYKNFIRIR